MPTIYEICPNRDENAVGEKCGCGYKAEIGGEYWTASDYNNNSVLIVYLKGDGVNYFCKNGVFPYALCH